MTFNRTFLACTRFLSAVVCGIGLSCGKATGGGWRGAMAVRGALAVMLAALMVMIPMGDDTAFAQAPAPAASPESQSSAGENQSGAMAAGAEEQFPEEEPLSTEQLDQLVAPVALYPDALLAQVLAASTYPAQVVEANRWLKTLGDLPPEQIAERADRMGWDPSVKALTAFPSVLERMDRNIKWTTDLGNAYYNQPDDVMDAVQAMRAQAQDAGTLRSTPQQTVTEEDGAIVIGPANPAVVYVPVYDPWAVWGYAIAPYSGFYFYSPPGIFVGGLLIGFGIGIGIGVWGHWGWGWHNWGVRWHDRSVFYNRARYRTHSPTVIRRHLRRPPAPPRRLEKRSPQRRPGEGIHRVPPQRPATPVRPGISPSRPGTAPGRPGVTPRRPGSTAPKATPTPKSAPAKTGAGGRPSGGSSGGRGSSGGGHSGGGKR